MLEQKYLPREPEPDPRSPLPLVGWALVIGSLISYGYLLYPLNLMDADWEFETMGALVDNSLLCLMGMALVLHGRQQALEMQQLITLRVLLVLSFIIGCFYMSMVPLSLSDERRLEEVAERQFVAGGALYTERAEKILNSLKKVTTIQDLKTLGGMLNIAPTPGERKALRLDEDVSQLQQWTQRQVREGLNFQKTAALQQHGRNLIKLQKGSIRIIAGASLAAVCYLLLCLMNFALFREHVAVPETPRSED